MLREGQGEHKDQQDQEQLTKNPSPPSGSRVSVNVFTCVLTHNTSMLLLVD